MTAEEFSNPLTSRGSPILAAQIFVRFSSDELNEKIDDLLTCVCLGDAVILGRCGTKFGASVITAQSPKAPLGLNQRLLPEWDLGKTRHTSIHRTISA